MSQPLCPLLQTICNLVHPASLTLPQQCLSYSPGHDNMIGLSRSNSGGTYNAHRGLSPIPDHDFTGFTAGTTSPLPFACPAKTYLAPTVVSGHHFSILSLSLASHHLTDYLTYHLIRAPNLVPHDWGACDHSHDPVTDYLTLTIDCSCDQACDLSRDTM